MVFSNRAWSFCTVHEYFSLKGKIRLLRLNGGIYSYVYLKFCFFSVWLFIVLKIWQDIYIYIYLSFLLRALA